MKNNKIIYVILGILIVSNIFTLAKINTLKINFETRLNDIQIIESSSNYRITVGEGTSVIDENNSIIESYELEIEENINIEDYTVNLYLKVIPKEMDEESKGSFKVGDNIIEMKKDGISFVGEAKISIFEDPDIKFILETQGIQKIKNIENYGTMDKFVTTVISYYEGLINYNKGNIYKFMGDNIIDVSAIYENQTIKKVEIVTRKNNDVLKRDEIDLEGEKNLVYKRIPFKEEIILEKGDTLEIYALVEMENGVIYKSKISKYESDGTYELIEDYEEKTTVEIVDREEKIFFKIQ